MANALDDCITGPITLEHFKVPVVLVPCAHKIEKIWAEKLYGNPKLGGWSIMPDKQKTCPTCRKQIIGYLVDHNLKNITENLSKVDLSKKSDSDKNSNQYPGKPSLFIYSPEVKNQFLIRHPTQVSNAISFRSINEDSAIENFTLYTLPNSTVSIEFHIRESLFKEFCDYINNLDIHFKIEKNILLSTSQEELYALFTILEKNNHIPKSHIESLQNLVYPDNLWNTENISSIWDWLKPFLC